MKESKYLKKLEEILPILKIKEESNCEFQYNTKNDEGTFIGIGLYKVPNIAMMRCFVSKGTESERHSHKEQEYLLVYKGSMEFHRERTESARIGGEVIVSNEFIMNQGDSVYVYPDEVHYGKALEDIWFLAITIPAACVFPEAK